MNPPAAFRATVHSLRQVPGRKICQLVLELPIEETASVAAIAEHGTWVAIARLQNPEAAAPATSGQEREALGETKLPAPLQPSDKPEKRKWHEMPSTQQAAMICGNAVFRKFIEEVHAKGKQINSSEEAARHVRQLCGVQSRKDIKPGSIAEHNWHILYEDFITWKFAEKAGLNLWEDA